jgi:hypothetical protein
LFNHRGYNAQSFPAGAGFTVLQPFPHRPFAIDHPQVHKSLLRMPRRELLPVPGHPRGRRAEHRPARAERQRGGDCGRRGPGHLQRAQVQRHDPGGRDTDLPQRQLRGPGGDLQHRLAQPGPKGPGDLADIPGSAWLGPPTYPRHGPEPPLLVIPGRLFTFARHIRQQDRDRPGPGHFNKLARFRAQAHRRDREAGHLDVQRRGQGRMPGGPLLFDGRFQLPQRGHRLRPCRRQDIP